MAITATYLTADLGANDVTMVVNSGTGFPTAGSSIANPGYLVRIDNEYMLAIQQPVAGTIKIAQRGYDGTAAVAHDTLARVLVSSAPGDFSPVAAGSQVELPPFTPLQQTIGEDITFTTAQVLAWGNQPRVFAILKATAAAITLVAPSTAQNGLTIMFTSLTAAAHVITATALVADGAAGSPEDTITFDAFIGASITLQAQAGLWHVVANVATVVT
jgi:hypothetical protein